MKISNLGPTSSSGKAKKKSSAGSGSSFASHLGESGSASESHGTRESAPVSNMSGILALQEVGDATEDEKRRAMYQRAEDILDKLGEIQRDILSGGISKDRLQNLAHMLRARRETVEDPKLLALMDEIELRAEVEIAKWTR